MVGDINQLNALIQRVRDVAVKQKAIIKDLKNKLTAEKAKYQALQKQKVAPSREAPATAEQIIDHAEIEALKQRLQEEISKSTQIAPGDAEFYSYKIKAEAEIAALNKKLSEEIKKGKDSSPSEFNSYKIQSEAEISALKRQLVAEREKVSELEKSDLESYKFKAETEISALKGQLDEEIKRMGQLRSDSNAKIMDLEEKYINLAESSKREKDVLSEKYLTLKKNSEQVSRYLVEIDEQKDQIRVLEKRVQELKKKITEAQTQIETDKNRIFDLKGEVKSLNIKIDLITKDSKALDLISIKDTLVYIEKEIFGVLEELDQNKLRLTLEQTQLMKEKVKGHNRRSDEIYTNVYNQINELELKLMNHLVQDEGNYTIPRLFIKKIEE